MSTSHHCALLRPTLRHIPGVEMEYHWCGAAYWHLNRFEIIRKDGRGGKKGRKDRRGRNEKRAGNVEDWDITWWIFATTSLAHKLGLKIPEFHPRKHQKQAKQWQKLEEKIPWSLSLSNSFAYYISQLVPFQTLSRYFFSSSWIILIISTLLINVIQIIFDRDSKEAGGVEVWLRSLLHKWFLLDWYCTSNLGVVGGLLYLDKLLEDEMEGFLYSFWFAGGLHCDSMRCSGLGYY